ncbi:MAG: hypothetical protein AAGF11_39885 [Myxococcota bacterium]
MRALALSALLMAGPVSCGDEIVGYRTSVTDGFADDPLPQFVAGGTDLRRVVSFDNGHTWEGEFVEPAPPEDSLVTDIARSPGRIVMVAGELTFTSDDGYQWESFQDLQGYITGVAYGGGLFVSVGFGGRRAYSEDGWGWINRPDPEEGANYLSIAYGDGRFVAVGASSMATSTDGQTWTTTPLPGSKLEAIAYGNGQFLAVGEEGGRVMLTRDGRTVDYDGTGPNVFGVCFFEGQWVASGWTTSWVSDDGREWAEFAHGRSIQSLACGPTVMVGAGDGLLFRAEDPTSWEQVGEVDGVLTRVRYTGI